MYIYEPCNKSLVIRNLSASLFNKVGIFMMCSKIPSFHRRSSRVEHHVWQLATVSRSHVLLRLWSHCLFLCFISSLFQFRTSTSRTRVCCVRSPRAGGITPGGITPGGITPGGITPHSSTLPLLFIHQPPTPSSSSSSCLRLPVPGYEGGIYTPTLT